MRLLFLGDIFARPGREAVTAYLPGLKQRYRTDIVIANGENATHGAGLSPKHGDELLEAGVDIITNGNHVWDKLDIVEKLDSDERYLRPANYPAHAPGRGVATYDINGYRIQTVNLLGQIGMKPSYDNPFVIAENILPPAGDPKSHGLDAIVVDMHAEATSEKAAMAYMLDGRATLVVGTHTHVPTFDARILPHGTGFQSDCGMCGYYDSVIGMDAAAVVQRFRQIIPSQRAEPAEGEGTLSGLLVETDEATGLAQKIAYIRRGGTILPEVIPDF